MNGVRERDKARGSFRIFTNMTNGEYSCSKSFKIMWNVCSFSLNFNISLSTQMGLVPYDAVYSFVVLEKIC